MPITENDDLFSIDVSAQNEMKRLLDEIVSSSHPDRKVLNELLQCIKKHMRFNVI